MDHNLYSSNSFYTNVSISTTLLGGGVERILEIVENYLFFHGKKCRDQLIPPCKRS